MSSQSHQSPAIAPTLDALQRLVEVIAQLRDPNGGCPWDLAQTPETLIPYVIEEAYEVADAIRSGDADAIAEELGDLLLQVVLQAQVAQDQGQFDLALVAQKITEKLIRRHPHVFAEVAVESLEDVHRNWEQIKATEKGHGLAETQKLTYQLKRYARSLPPLTAALKISQKAAATGFEWESIAGVWAKFQEELSEFQHALDYESKAAQEAELGDLLFTLVNLARWQDLDPAAALQGTSQRLIQRLSEVEAVVDRPLSEYTLDELEQFWQQAKARLAKDEA